MKKVLFDPLPENLVLLLPLNPLELTGYYLRASFYSQFFSSEGLPNALCEAMLYGCIPIGTKTGGIPTAIGNTGLVLENWNAKIVADFAIKNQNKFNRNDCNSRIIEKFDLSFRKEKLLTVN